MKAYRPHEYKPDPSKGALHGVNFYVEPDEIDKLEKLRKEAKSCKGGVPSELKKELKKQDTVVKQKREYRHFVVEKKLYYLCPSCLHYQLTLAIQRFKAARAKWILEGTWTPPDCSDLVQTLTPEQRFDGAMGEVPQVVPSDSDSEDDEDEET